MLSKADAESALGVMLLPPAPIVPFRSLLDPDFTSGTADQGCACANFKFNYATPNQPRPPKVIQFNLEVHYSAAPDGGAIDKARREVDKRTYEHPSHVAGLGDGAFSIGHGSSLELLSIRRANTVSIPASARPPGVVSIPRHWTSLILALRLPV